MREELAVAATALATGPLPARLFAQNVAEVRMQPERPEIHNLCELLMVLLCVQGRVARAMPLIESRTGRSAM